jgi:hypothetical protein
MILCVLKNTSVFKRRKLMKFLFVFLTALCVFFTACEQECATDGDEAPATVDETSDVVDSGDAVTESDTVEPTEEDASAETDVEPTEDDAETADEPDSDPEEGDDDSRGDS